MSDFKSQLILKVYNNILLEQGIPQSLVKHTRVQNGYVCVETDTTIYKKKITDEIKRINGW